MLAAEPHRAKSTEKIPQRVEGKYIVTEEQAEAVREYIHAHVTPDPHIRKGITYNVYTMYLDSPDLRLYQDVQRGLKNRFKLRIRYYDNKPDKPIYLEIKRNNHNVIKKQRASLPREMIPHIVFQRDLPPEFIPRLSRRQIQHLYRFRDYMQSLSASPRVLVRYSREAYIGRVEGHARITFDRQIACHPVSPDDFENSKKSWFPLTDIPVLLEIKFSDNPPAWITEMTDLFGLVRCAFSKYCACTEELKKRGLATTR